jgi:hypothetical protein
MIVITLDEGESIAVCHAQTQDIDIITANSKGFDIEPK